MFLQGHRYNPLDHLLSGGVVHNKPLATHLCLNQTILVCYCFVAEIRLDARLVHPFICIVAVPAGCVLNFNYSTLMWDTREILF